jgi:Na+-transporting methylmalonyl-CoA/oxaloacetate decarboxylase gamma subunit
MKKAMILSVLMVFMITMAAPVATMAQEPAKKECTKEAKKECKKDESKACDKTAEKSCCKKNETAKK